MTLERFRRLVESYGAQSERWPEAERDAARALLESSPEARELCRAEALLDAELGAFEPSPLSAALARRLNEIPIRVARPRRWPRRVVWASAAAWALSALSGLWLGDRFGDDEAVSATQGIAPAAALSEDAALELASGALAELEDLP